MGGPPFGKGGQVGDRPGVLFVAPVVQDQGAGGVPGRHGLQLRARRHELRGLEDSPFEARDQLPEALEPRLPRHGEGSLDANPHPFQALPVIARGRGRLKDLDGNGVFPEHLQRGDLTGPDRRQRRGGRAQLLHGPCHPDPEAGGDVRRRGIQAGHEDPVGGGRIPVVLSGHRLEEESPESLEDGIHHPLHHNLLPRQRARGAGALDLTDGKRLPVEDG